jgi:structural maintenance of chromosome 2
VAIEEKRASTSKDAAAFAELKAAYDAGAAGLAKSEELLQTLLTGLSSTANGDDEGAGGYLGQLAEAKAELAAAGTEAEQAKVKIGLAEREIKEKEPRAKKAEKEGEGLLKELASKRGEVEKLKQKVGGAGWDENKEKTLLEKQVDHSGKMTQLMDVSAILSHCT